MVYPPFSLSATGLVASLVLIVLYAAALLRIDAARDFLNRFPRARGVGILLLTIDVIWAWLLLRGMDLGEFSNLRMPLLILVPVGYVLTLRFVEEFLAVRALGMLMLLCAEPLLEAAFLKPQTSRLFLVVLAYVMIVKGMFWVGMPYLFRDWGAWAARSSSRMRAGLIAGLAYGIILLILSLTQYRSA